MAVLHENELPRILALAAEQTPAFSLTPATHAVYVSKEGADTNTGLSIDKSKLTINGGVEAAEALLLAGADAVAVNVLDGGIYTEASGVTVPTLVNVVAPGASFIGAVTTDALSSFEIGTHYAGADGQRMANRSFTTDGPSFYRARISEGRGVEGTLNNTRNIDNSGGTGKNFFVETDLLYVTSNGEGIDGDTAGSAGHIHFRIKDLYLAGSSSQGIRAAHATANFIGYIDHILEVGTPSSTRGIHVLDAGAVVRVHAAQIVADTAFEVSAGTLILNCLDVTGTETHTGGTVVRPTLSTTTI